MEIIMELDTVKNYFGFIHSKNLSVTDKYFCETFTL